MNYKLAKLIAESEASDADVIEFINESKKDPLAYSIGLCFLKDDSEIFNFLIERNFDLDVCTITIPEIKDLELLGEIITVIIDKHPEVSEITNETIMWRTHLQKHREREEEKEEVREESKEKACA